MIQLSSPHEPHILDLIKDLREAFCLTFQQAKPIAGWSPDGSGELTDNQLDDFLMSEIVRNRNDWEKNKAAFYSATGYAFAILANVF